MIKKEKFKEKMIRKNKRSKKKRKEGVRKEIEIMKEGKRTNRRK